MICNIVALAGCIASIKYGSQAHIQSHNDFIEDVKSLSSSINSNNDNEKNSVTTVSSIPSLNQSNSDRRMKNTFGWARIDIMTMLVCCVFLASFCFSLLVEALQTLCHIDHIDAMHHPLPVMFIGISGILLNGFCYVIIGGYTFNQALFLHVTKEGNVILDKNFTSSKEGGELKLTAPKRRSPIAVSRRQGFKEMCRHGIGCIFVIITSIIVYLTNADIAKYIDPIFAIISSVWLFVLSYPYLKESCMILLQTIPNHINIDSLKTELTAAFPGIISVHDFHVWHLAGSKVISTIHIIFLDQTVYINTIQQVSDFFSEIGITQVTIQPEFHNKNIGDTDCLIRCRGEKCTKSQCCINEEGFDEVITDKVDEQSTQTIITERIIENKINTASSSNIDLRKLTNYNNKNSNNVITQTAECSKDVDSAIIIISDDNNKKINKSIRNKCEKKLY